MCTFKDFLRYHKNKDLVQTLIAMQKTLAFYHKNRIHRLDLGCTLPSLANVCLHKSTTVKLYPSNETDKDLLQRNRKDELGGLCIAFTREAVVDETFIRNSGSNCISFVGIDASQLCPYSLCQPMPKGL